MTTAPRIDCHAHIYTRAMPLAPDAWHRPPGDATVAQYLDQLRRHGISHGVLAAASLYGTNNAYALSATGAHPNLKTTVIVAPSADRATLLAMQAVGAVGFRLQLRNRLVPDLTAPDWQGLLGHMAAIGWHMELHDDLVRLPPLIEAVERAGVRLVVDHFGRPANRGEVDGPAFEALLAAVGRGNCWVKVASGFRLEDPAAEQAAFDRLLARGGAQRLLWGSDWPFANFEDRVSYPSAITDYRRIAPDPALRAAIDRTGFAFYFPECVPPDGIA
ncbi:amidohydrolase family protein [Sphingomonas flavalba]|uniref:amidohydrolase family protein n=1 Tax=Sphingomonas flavalba TaxID=2559804 RepID=UPI0039E1AD7F